MLKTLVTKLPVDMYNELKSVYSEVYANYEVGTFKWVTHVQ